MGKTLQERSVQMRFNPKIHNRKSIRLKGYDYSKEGYYFITLCSKERKCILGNIEYVKNYSPIYSECFRINLSTKGNVIKHYLTNINFKYQNIKLDNYTIMPNHIHIIIRITSTSIDFKTSISKIINSFKNINF